MALSVVKDSLNETDHELRSLLWFAAGLGVDDATVFEIYAVVRKEASAAGDVTAEERMAEARRRLVRAAS
ncbi:hypothetical protein [Methylobacterium sp. CCH5-D2]|uniref:hypothetical protein n=1 Tax=Methylobacterium sp. CCH5-D2 TaxID=1768765 RepID=UPI0008341281|nr:hypothetical protein [Methylobacterium sp. CCH5-D2]